MGRKTAVVPWPRGGGVGGWGGVDGPQRVPGG